MPTVTLTRATAETLGLTRTELSESTLTPDAARVLEGLLASRGFDTTRTVHVQALSNDGGFLLMQ
jgi:hypothetical protein